MMMNNKQEIQKKPNKNIEELDEEFDDTIQFIDDSNISIP